MTAPTEDDARLIEIIKTIFWARLEYLEGQVDKAATIPLMINRHADKVSKRDNVAGDWIRESHNPEVVRSRLEAIRLQAEHGSFTEAWLELEQLERHGQHAWVLSTTPVLSVGERQVSAGVRGNEMRTDNSFAATRAEAAQARADQIAAGKPNLTWAAIRNILAREFGVSDKTLKNNLRNPKKSG